MGGGGRSDKVRTYNFKENRVSDHRINLTLYKLDKVLAGELDDISDALVQRRAGPAPHPSRVRLGALLIEAEARLGSAGSDGPDLEARRIVEEASGLSGAELVLAADEPVTERVVAHVEAMVARRQTGEPLQYVVGRWGFRRLDLLVDRRVLIPRPETEQLVDHALAELEPLAAGRPWPKRRGEASCLTLDLGTGSGAIALALVDECPAVAVWGVERSPDALAVARANLAGLGRAGARVRLAEGSWFDPLPTELAGTVDVIVANPPYVAEVDRLPDEVRRWEPVDALISGPTGLEAIERIAGEASQWLRPGGVLVVEIGETQGEAAVAVARNAGLADVEVRRDLNDRDRFLVAAGGAASATVR